MARRAHDLRRALDANVNGTRIHNRIIVYVRVCRRRIADVSGAAARIQRLCGAHAVAVGVMAHELVVACSACARAL